MPCPTVRQLSDSRLSPRELGALLQKHIGDGSNEFHCEQAYKELRRIRDPRIQQFIGVTARCFPVPEFTYSAIMNVIIEALQSDGWN